MGDEENDSLIPELDDLCGVNDVYEPPYYISSKARKIVDESTAQQKPRDSLSPLSHDELAKSVAKTETNCALTILILMLIVIFLRFIFK